MNHPANEFVASLVGVENILQGKVVRGDRGTFFVFVSGQEIEAIGDADLGEPVSLCIRPENVALLAIASGDLTSVTDTFPGTVEKITPIGHYKKVLLNCGFPLVAYATSHSLSELSVKEGTEVLDSFKATAVHVIKKGTSVDS